MEDVNASDNSPKATKLCPHCKKEISIEAKRCPYCQSDLRNWMNRHPLAMLLLVIVGGLFVLASVGNSSGNSNESHTDTDTSTSLSPNSSPDQIAEATGVSLDNIKAAYPIVARYNLSTSTQTVVIEQSAYLHALETNSTYSAALQQAGMGSFDATTDAVAHLVSAWNVNDSDIATSTEALFSAMTNSSLSWNDLTSALITNGSKMNSYVSLKEAIIQLTALCSQSGLTNSTVIDTFNSIGDSVQDPTTPLNQALGGTGSVRTLVSQPDGIVNSFQKITDYIQSNSPSSDSNMDNIQ